MAKDPTARWETCRLESLSHWLDRWIGPRDSHSDWYRKWGKTVVGLRFGPS